MSEERRLAVLRAIVQDYVADLRAGRAPRRCVERHQLGVSAATVRNDMAVLEEEGLIHAPHTSAGRVPTDAGYRLFVDRLSSVKPMSAGRAAGHRARSCDGAVDLDDVVDRTVRLLASLTHQVAVMQYPSLTRSSVRHVELVPIGPRPADGRAHRRHRPGRAARRRHRRRPVGAEGERARRDVRARLNAEAAGLRLTEAAARLQSLPEQFEPADRDLVRAVVALARRRPGRGARGARRARRHRQPGPVRHRLPADHRPGARGARGARRAAQAARRRWADDADAVAVRIGHENPHAGLQSTSVVSAPATAPAATSSPGSGVLGPTRMDYPTTMASVRAVARYVSRILG